MAQSHLTFQLLIDSIWMQKSKIVHKYSQVCHLFSMLLQGYFLKATSSRCPNHCIVENVARVFVYATL